MTEDNLLSVRKPARYIGKEWNSSAKEFSKSFVKFALCFPDLYEVGMSNLGIRILCALLNKIEDTCCERFFAPALDFEELIRSGKEAFVSLESGRLMKEFDIIGFSLGYELGYTNVLNMLNLSGIPLASCERSSEFPLVIAGGPCVLNPEPMHEFFDIFLIGEAEEALIELVDLYRKHKEAFKSNRLKKEEFLILCSQLEGIYVPSLYNVEYSLSGKITSFTSKFENVPRKIRKRIVKDFDNAFFPVDWVVPYIEIVHDRITLEIMRGCPNKCRFCQARQQYFPLRVRNSGTSLELAKQSYKKTGYEEISLAGLSISDYPYLKELLDKLILYFKEKAVSIALPSIKPKIYLGDMTKLIATIKKTGLTFAPEAATEELRNILNKDFDMVSFLKALKEAYAHGYQRVKLYFLTGIPFEKDDHLDKIINFATDVSRLRKEVSKGSAFVNVSINTLIPKPHTSFQWQRMISLEEMNDRQLRLRSMLRNNKIQVNFHNPNLSFLEGIISRGDRRLGKVIKQAYLNGAKFDGWQEYFNFSFWQKAFEETGIEPKQYLEEKKKDEILPWDFLDLGIDKSFLLQEYDKLIDIKEVM